MIRLPSLPKRVLCLLPAALALASGLHAFCGFYVAQADTKLFNRASKVAIVRDGDRTVLTMANDYEGDPRHFAMVVPVPTFITREQIHVAEPALLDHLDAYSAPRLVEYFDSDPCARLELEESLRSLGYTANAAQDTAAPRRKSLGVTIEATYDVGEYDVLILSARDSKGLEEWLRRNRYSIPRGASRILDSYLKQGMRFFVAKVDLGEQTRSGRQFLRPLQIAFETPKFVLPIRLGTLNAEGDQELYVFTLTRHGRVETTNYRTVRLPSGQEVPEFVKADFGDFYRDLFSRQVAVEAGRGVFLEYAWDMAWCDPCAADPLSTEELRQLGVFWLDDRSGRTQAQNVFLTRLHLRYDGATFPEDLVFHQTGDRSNFQGRYVVRHAWTGEASCPQAETYLASLPERWEREARTLSHLTGWDLEEIRRRLPEAPVVATAPVPWWKKLWP